MPSQRQTKCNIQVDLSDGDMRMIVGMDILIITVEF